MAGEGTLLNFELHLFVDADAVKESGEMQDSSWSPIGPRTGEILAQNISDMVTEAVKQTH